MTSVLIGMTVLLGGCLEVEQHPAWQNGHYNGKPDALPHQTHFRNDRLMWMGVLVNRNHLQDEYVRMRPEDL